MNESHGVEFSGKVAPPRDMTEVKAFLAWRRENKTPVKDNFLSAVGVFLSGLGKVHRRTNREFRELRRKHRADGQLES